MHILICSTDYPPLLGGISRYSYHIADELAKRDRVKVLAVRTPGGEAFDRQQRFATVRVPNIPVLREALLLRQILAIHRTEPVDWIVNAVWFPCGLVSHLAHRSAGIKYVIAAHGSDILDDYLTYRRTIKSLLKGWKYRMLARAQLALPGSRYTRDRLIASGISTPMTVLHYGVDPAVFHPMPRNPVLMTQLGIAAMTPVLLSVGRLDLHKGCDVVIQALPRVLKEVPGLVYVIVGEGPERDRLSQLVERLNLTKNVLMVGRVEDAHIAEYYNLCDVFIMASREMAGRTDLVEGFGIAFLEAGACGKPVIGGNSGGVSDAVLDGQTGLLVDPLNVQAVADAVIRLCKDSAYAQELGRNGRRRCEDELNWTRIAARLHNTLSEQGTARR